jgi:class 3 adenylate cyclase
MQHTLELSLRSPAGLAWAFLADTDRADAAAGLPAITYRDEPQPDGTSRRFFSYRLRGLRVQGEEFPFTWEFPRRFRVERVYSHGPFSRAVHECVVTPSDTGCRAVHTFDFEPRGLLGRVFAWGFAREVMPAMRAWFEQQDAAANAAEQAPTAPPGRAPQAVDTARIHALQEQAHTVYDCPVIDEIAQLLEGAPDADVERLRPRQLARELGRDERDVLNSLLATTKVGMTRLRWDVICPHCRGDKQNLDSLDALEERAFCPSCNIDFDVDLDRALEAVFVPHPKARAVETARYCLGGPGVTPHIRAQDRIPAGATWSPTVVLPQGRYRLRCTGTDQHRWLVTAPGTDAAGTDTLTVRDSGLEGGDLRLPSDLPSGFQVRNLSGRPVVAVLEELTWANDALPAGRVVADQRFRELFAHEMLAPGVRLAVESVTIMFTDLVGSTAMYSALGDARAFNLVWNHFDVLRDVVRERSGAQIKTIGDAIMAVFMDPTDALGAAADLHDRLAPHLATVGHDYPAALKIGMHTGPAIAVTLNDRVDYFGTTVNLAARTEGQSAGEDILVTASTADESGAVALLGDRGWSGDRFEASVKGFDARVPMVRFTRADPGSQRT